MKLLTINLNFVEMEIGNSDLGHFLWEDFLVFIQKGGDPGFIGGLILEDSILLQRGHATAIASRQLGIDTVKCMVIGQEQALDAFLLRHPSSAKIETEEARLAAIKGVDLNKIFLVFFHGPIGESQLHSLRKFVDAFISEYLQSFSGPHDARVALFGEEGQLFFQIPFLGSNDEMLSRKVIAFLHEIDENHGFIRSVNGRSRNIWLG